MTTWVWILIAIAAAVVVVALSAARSRNQVNDSENTQGVTPGNANAGTDGQDRTGSVLRPLPDTQPGQTDTIRHSGLENAGSDGSTVLRRLSEAQPGQPDLARHSALADADSDGQDRASSVLRPPPGTRTGPDPIRHSALGGDPTAGGLPWAQLLEDHEMESIRGQWKDIQAAFVDEPRQAVQEADALVNELMQRLAQKFASEREQLESQWAGGADVSTEDLRRGLRQYRSFFERLLAA